MGNGLFWVSVVHIRVVIIKFTLIFHWTFREGEQREREREKERKCHGRSSCFSPELWNYLWLQSICRTSRGISGNCFKRVMARPLSEFTSRVTSCHNKNVDIVRDGTTAVRDYCELTRMIGRRLADKRFFAKRFLTITHESYA